MYLDYIYIYIGNKKLSKEIKIRDNCGSVLANNAPQPHLLSLAQQDGRKKMKSHHPKHYKRNSRNIVVIMSTVFAICVASITAVAIATSPLQAAHPDKGRISLPLSAGFFRLSDPMHGIKDFAALDADLKPELLPQERQCLGKLGKLREGNIHNHDHIKQSGKYRLRDIQNVGIMQCQFTAYSGNNADGIPAHYRNNGLIFLFHNSCLLFSKSMAAAGKSGIVQLSFPT